MNRILRIAQVSDCHLPVSPDKDYRGINAYENLQRVLQKVAKFLPDLLIASGDLSEDASPESYAALKTYFDRLDVPVLALPGNHDEPALLAEAFPGSPIDEPQVTNHGAWQIIRMNSCIEGRPEGCLSSASLTQLRIVLMAEPERPRIIVLHHQPVLVGSPWIDKYRLQEPEAFLQMVDQYSSIKAVLWGHVHQEFACNQQDTLMLAGPSSAINSSPGEDKFTPDLRGPGFRWLLANDDAGLSSGVSWSDASAG